MQRLSWQTPFEEQLFGHSKDIASQNSPLNPGKHLHFAVED